MFEAIAHNKKIKHARFAGWDAYTQGGFAIMPHVPAPVIEKLGAKVFTWLTRNFSLLIGGIILLPLTLFLCSMSLAFGAGFTNDPTVSSLKIIAGAVSYLVIFSLSVWLSLRSYNTYGNYGHWDLLPIIYFTVGVLAMLIQGSI